MQIDPQDPMGQAIYLYGCYDYPITRLLETIITTSTVFFDVGANVGFFSLLASTKCDHVYAFEPLPSNLKRLARNMEINGLQNVTVIERAVGDHAGRATLYVPESDNSGLASLNASVGGKALEVPLITLDGFVRERELKQIDVMKIDIEGAEVLAFEGARELLTRNDAPDVIFEAHPGSEAAQWLKSRGYAIYEFRLHREWEARNLLASRRKLAANVRKQVREV